MSVDWILINILLDKTARDEATSIMEQLHETESEVKSLKTMFQRMLLTQEEVVFISFSNQLLNKFTCLFNYVNEYTLCYVFF